MEFDEFTKLLNEKNPHYTRLVETIGSARIGGYCLIERKGKDLLELVQELLDKKLFLVTDKKLRLVFGLISGYHEIIRALLYQYHTANENPNLPHIDRTEAADLYIESGLGWFISSMNPNFIITGKSYKPDRFDKDVFLFYDVDLVL